MKGDDLYAKGQYNESLAAYEKAISLDPVSLKSWQGKGKALLALGRSDEAVTAFNRSLKLDPGDAGTYALIGDARSAAGEYKDAAEQYLKALAMNPKIEGVSEKLSAVYAAENLVLGVGNKTAVTIVTPSITRNVTVEEPNMPLPTTTIAGSSGADTGILLSFARWIQENMNSFFKG
jgi:tetratricopeptide (TPR) repeat protein